MPPGSNAYVNCSKPLSQIYLFCRLGVVVFDFLTQSPILCIPHLCGGMQYFTKVHVEKFILFLYLLANCIDTLLFSVVMPFDFVCHWTL